MTKYIFLFYTILTMSANAATHSNQYYNNYIINGDSIEQIHSSIKKHGPKSRNGHSFAAKTNYHVSWNYQFTKNNDYCHINNVDTFVDIFFYMPKLITNRPSPLQVQWQGYFNALKHHEEIHGQYGVMAAKEIEYKLKSLQVKCNILKSTTEKIAQQVLRKYDQINIEFDHVSNHGQKTNLLKAAKLSK